MTEATLQPDPSLRIITASGEQVVPLSKEEMRLGRTLTPHVVVNDDLESAVAQVIGILDAHRTSRPPSAGGDPRGA